MAITLEEVFNLMVTLQTEKAALLDENKKLKEALAQKDKK